MKYTVRWLPDAEQELVAVWLGAADRNAISRAAFSIDEQLELDPLDVGESRDLGQRILVAWPLAALFQRECSSWWKSSQRFANAVPEDFSLPSAPFCRHTNVTCHPCFVLAASLIEVAVCPAADAGAGLPYSLP